MITIPETTGDVLDSSDISINSGISFRSFYLIYGTSKKTISGTVSFTDPKDTGYTQQRGYVEGTVTATFTPTSSDRNYSVSVIPDSAAMTNGIVYKITNFTKTSFDIEFAYPTAYAAYNQGYDPSKLITDDTVFSYVVMEYTGNTVFLDREVLLQSLLGTPLSSSEISKIAEKRVASFKNDTANLENDERLAISSGSFEIARMPLYADAEDYSISSSIFDSKTYVEFTGIENSFLLMLPRDILLSIIYCIQNGCGISMQQFGTAFRHNALKTLLISQLSVSGNDVTIFPRYLTGGTGSSDTLNYRAYVLEEQPASEIISVTIPMMNGLAYGVQVKLNSNVNRYTGAQYRIIISGTDGWASQPVASDVTSNGFILSGIGFTTANMTLLCTIYYDVQNASVYGESGTAQPMDAGTDNGTTLTKRYRISLSKVPYAFYPEYTVSFFDDVVQNVNVITAGLASDMDASAFTAFATFAEGVSDFTLHYYVNYRVPDRLSSSDGFRFPAVLSVLPQDNTAIISDVCHAATGETVFTAFNRTGKQASALSCAFASDDVISAIADVPSSSRFGNTSDFIRYTKKTENGLLVYHVDLTSGVISSQYRQDVYTVFANPSTMNALTYRSAMDRISATVSANPSSDFLFYVRSCDVAGFYLDPADYASGIRTKLFYYVLYFRHILYILTKQQFCRILGCADSGISVQRVYMPSTSNDYKTAKTDGVIPKIFPSFTSFTKTLKTIPDQYSFTIERPADLPIDGVAWNIQATLTYSD